MIANTLMRGCTFGATDRTKAIGLAKILQQKLISLTNSLK